MQDGREQGREPDGGGVPQGLLARRRAVQDAGAQRGDIDPDLTRHCSYVSPLDDVAVQRESLQYMNLKCVDKCYIQSFYQLVWCGSF